MNHRPFATSRQKHPGQTWCAILAVLTLVPLANAQSQPDTKDEPNAGAVSDKPWKPENKKQVELRKYFRGQLGRQDNEPIEISELEDVLDDFERKFKVLIPNRDVLTSSPTAIEHLVPTIDRALFQNPSALKPPSLSTGIGGQSFSQLKPFQKRDLLNNPGELLGQRTDVPPGAGDRTDRFSDQESKTLVAEAILKLMPELGDPKGNSALAQRRAAGEPISNGDYARIVRSFLNSRSPDFASLEVAIARVTTDARKTRYSNNQPRFNERGIEVYPNGQPKVDRRGQPLYPNGRPKYDSAGRSLHSNGTPRFSSQGIRLNAEGRRASDVVAPPDPLATTPTSDQKKSTDSTATDPRP